MSPKLEHKIELLNFHIKMAQFPKERHLQEREVKYVMPPYIGGDIFIIRETAEGWWREEINYKADPEAQIEKLRNDPTVAVGWFGTPRFSSNGGWFDPNG